MSDRNFPGDFSGYVDVGGGSDTVVGPYTGFMVGTDGNVAIEDSEGNAITLPACKAGAQYFTPCARIMATNTTATGIVGFKR